MSHPSSNSPGITCLPVWKIAAGRHIETDDPVAVEQPLEIRLQYGPAGARIEENVSVTMRTPGQDTELAVGSLFTEGIITDVTAILRVQTATDSVLVALSDALTPDLSRLQRHSYTNSSCGVCGKLSIDALRIPVSHAPSISIDALRTAGPATSIDALPTPGPAAPISALQTPGPAADQDDPIDAALLFDLPRRLRNDQDLFDSTGGLHAAGLFDRQGRLIALREDIGRHNALDKLIGHALMNTMLPATDHILLLSGRACFELIQKAAMAGIRIVAAVGPPSTAAVQLAAEYGITLAGFLRQQRFNIYSGAHRIRI